MKWFQNLILAGLTCLALLPLTGVSPARADQNRPGASVAEAPQARGQGRVYRVYYRQCPRSPWVCYGVYYNRHEARQAISAIRSSGHDAFYR